MNGTVNYCIVIVALSFFCGSVSHSEPRAITVYAYHDSLPFVINAQSSTGLNYDFAKALQLSMGDEYSIEYQFLDRSSLNQRLAENKPSIVMWANPSWFESSGQPYLWSQAIFTDASVVLSLRDNEVDYFGPESLYEKTIGVIKGHKYDSDEPLLASDKIHRIEVDNDNENIELLLARQIDALFIVKSSALYLVRSQGLIAQLSMAIRPLYSYRRHLLFSSDYQDIYPVINRALMSLHTQDFWRKRLVLYGIDSL